MQHKGLFGHFEADSPIFTDVIWIFRAATLFSKTFIDLYRSEYLVNRFVQNSVISFFSPNNPFEHAVFI